MIYRGIKIESQEKQQRVPVQTKLDNHLRDGAYKSVYCWGILHTHTHTRCTAGCATTEGAALNLTRNAMRNMKTT